MRSRFGNKIRCVGMAGWQFPATFTRQCQPGTPHPTIPNCELDHHQKKNTIMNG